MARRSSDYIHMALEHGIDIPSRTIYLTSYVGSDGEEAGVDHQLSSRLLTGIRLLSTGDNPITLVINNFGGEDDHARAIIGAIKQSSVEIHGVVLGRAESAAAWILQHCKYRTMDSHSNLMLHMGSSDKNKHSKYIDNMFVEDILKRVREKLPEYKKSTLVKQLHDDWFIYPEQALELGLIDEII